MVLLRLLADILLYLTFALLVYWFFINDITTLWIAIGSGIISALLFMYTADINRSRRNRHSNPSRIWDWFDFIDIIEIPLRLLWWLFSNIWRIFD